MRCGEEGAAQAQYQHCIYLNGAINGILGHLAVRGPLATSDKQHAVLGVHADRVVT